MRLVQTLNKFSKFGEVVNARQVIILIEGNALIPPSPEEIRDVFLSDNWSLKNVSIQSPPSAYFRIAQVVITANVFNQYSDAQITLKARELMGQFLTVTNVSLVKSGQTPDDILAKNDSDFSQDWKSILGIAGLSTTVIFAGAIVLAVIVLKK